MTKVLKEFIPRLSHDADGLIFQVVEAEQPILVLVHARDTTLDVMV